MGSMLMVGGEGRCAVGREGRSNRFSQGFRDLLRSSADELKRSGMKRRRVVNALIDQFGISISAAYRATSREGFSKHPPAHRRHVSKTPAEQDKPGTLKVLTPEQTRLVLEYKAMAPSLVVNTLNACGGSMALARQRLDNLRYNGGAQSMRIADWTAALRNSAALGERRREQN